MVVDRKKIGKASKNKGKVGERELANKLKEYGFDDVRRSVQYNGRHEEGQPDLTGLDGIHVECKRVEKLNIYDAIEQAKRECGCTELPFGYDLPAVFHRKNNHEWLVTMPMEFWIELYREWVNGRN
ncbi:hypothetical protein [Lachnoclostridium sp.]|uniref:hypothetical protein n=1 Tax=Lachnoclostridium sp. TaxID=2028282 RepID=UPI00289E1791|nr:hypothetical protein [Lachnoclostridium sp.]